MWIEKHQAQTADFDITDAVVNRIAENCQKESMAEKVRTRVLVNFQQAKALMRTCVLVAGALAGALRMLFVVYYALFT